MSGVGLDDLYHATTFRVSDRGVVPLASEDLNIARVLFSEDDSEVESSNFSTLGSDDENTTGRDANKEPYNKDLE